MTREELLSKIEAATGPLDDKTACEIWALGRGDIQVIRGPHRGDDGGDEYLITYMDGTYNHVNASELPDRSIDAALGLVERLLPDLSADITRYRNGKGACRLWRSDPTHPGLHITVADSDEQNATVPLAILAALLNADCALPPSNEAAR